MNKLSFYTKTYSSLRNRPGIPFWFFTPLRRLVRACANRSLPVYLAKTRLDVQKKTDSVIVSFTSFPARIDNVWQVVECMFRQTVQPAKILLWLSKEQFPTLESVPLSLRERENDIFEIRMVEGDIRSHKKYYYVSKEYPDSLIFLIDDDIYYPIDILERTLKARKEYPDSVICNYGSHIRYNPDGSLKPYNLWEPENGQSDANDLFFGSGGGTLLCPSELHSDLTNIEIARLLAPFADDVWLNSMVKLAGKPICMLKNGPILPIREPRNKVLWTSNVEEGGNDNQILAVRNYYIGTYSIDPFEFSVVPE